MSLLTLGSGISISHDDGSGGAAHTHTYYWNWNDNKHWKECKCGVTIQTGDHKDEWKSSDTKHWQKCKTCGRETTKAYHKNYSNEYDNSQHWKQCGVCSYKKNVANHSLTTTPKDDNYHKTYCTSYMCQYIAEDNVPHSYNQQKSDADNHWKACVCGKETAKQKHTIFDYFQTSDTKHTKVCRDCKRPIEERQHDYTSKYNRGFNSTNHWNRCICGKDEPNATLVPHTLEAENTYMSDVTHQAYCTACSFKDPYQYHKKIATPSSSRTHYYVCSCGYEWPEVSCVFNNFIVNESNENGHTVIPKCQCGNTLAETSGQHSYNHDHVCNTCKRKYDNGNTGYDTHKFNSQWNCVICGEQLEVTSVEGYQSLLPEGGYKTAESSIEGAADGIRINFNYPPIDENGNFMSLSADMQLYDHMSIYQHWLFNNPYHETYQQYEKAVKGKPLSQTGGRIKINRVGPASSPRMEYNGNTVVISDWPPEDHVEIMNVWVGGRPINELSHRLYLKGSHPHDTGGPEEVEVTLKYFDDTNNRDIVTPIKKDVVKGSTTKTIINENIVDNPKAKWPSQVTIDYERTSNVDVSPSSSKNKINANTTITYHYVVPAEPVNVTVKYYDDTNKQYIIPDISFEKSKGASVSEIVDEHILEDFSDYPDVTLNYVRKKDKITINPNETTLMQDTEITYYYIVSDGNVNVTLKYKDDINNQIFHQETKQVAMYSYLEDVKNENIVENPNAKWPDEVKKSYRFTGNIDADPDDEDFIIQDTTITYHYDLPYSLIIEYAIEGTNIVIQRPQNYEGVLTPYVFEDYNSIKDAITTNINKDNGAGGYLVTNPQDSFGADFADCTLDPAATKLNNSLYDSNALSINNPGEDNVIRYIYKKNSGVFFKERYFVIEKTGFNYELHAMNADQYIDRWTLYEYATPCLADSNVLASLWEEFKDATYIGYDSHLMSNGPTCNIIQSFMDGKTVQELYAAELLKPDNSFDVTIHFGEPSVYVDYIYLKENPVYSVTIQQKEEETGELLGDPITITVDENSDFIFDEYAWPQDIYRDNENGIDYTFANKITVNDGVTAEYQLDQNAEKYGPVKGAVILTAWYNRPKCEVTVVYKIYGENVEVPNKDPEHYYPTYGTPLDVKDDYDQPVIYNGREYQYSDTTPDNIFDNDRKTHIPSVTASIYIVRWYGDKPGTEGESELEIASVKLRSNKRGDNTEEFDVEKAIPTSEDVYANVIASPFKIEWDEIKRVEAKGQIKYTFAAYYKEPEYDDETGEVTGYKEGKLTSSTPALNVDYAYFYPTGATLYKLQGAKVENDAVETITGSGTVDKIITLEPNNYEAPQLLIHTDPTTCGLINNMNIEEPEYINDKSSAFESYAAASNALRNMVATVGDDRLEKLKEEVRVQNGQLAVMYDGQLTTIIPDQSEAGVDALAGTLNISIPTSIKLDVTLGDNVLYKWNEQYIKSDVANDKYETNATVYYTSEATNDKPSISAKGNDVIVHTPVVNNSEITNDNSAIAQLSQKGSEDKIVVLGEEFTLEIPNSGAHLETTEYKGYGNRNYNYRGVGIDENGKKTEEDHYAKKKAIKFDVGVYYKNGDKWDYKQAGTEYEYPLEETIFTFIVPIGEEEKWHGDEKDGYAHALTKVYAENYEAGSDTEGQPNANLDPSKYIATSDVKFKVVGKISDLEIIGSDDQDWPGLKANDPLRAEQGEMPIGQANQNERPNYNYALKLGYAAYLDLTITGNNGQTSSKVNIKPSFYYVSKDGGNAEKVNLYYSDKVGTVKELNESRLMQRLVVSNQIGGKYKDTWRFSEELVKGAERRSRNYLAPVEVGSPTNVLLKRDETALPYVTKISGLSQQQKSPNKEVVNGNSMVEHVYGLMCLPSATYALGTSDQFKGINSNFKKNGYIIVVFDKVQTTLDDGTVYLDYGTPNDSATAWPKGATKTLDLPNGKTATNVPDGAAVIYETDYRAVQDNVIAISY